MKHYKEEELFMFMDGQYNKESEISLKAHLEKCAECSRLYNELYILDKHLGQIPPDLPSSHFTDTILSRLYPNKQPVATFNFSISYYLMVIGTVITLSVLLFSMSSLTYFDSSILHQIGLSPKLINSLAALMERLSGAKELIIDGLLGTGTILLLVLLDKVVLVSYFKKRRREKMTLSR